MKLFQYSAYLVSTVVTDDLIEEKKCKHIFMFLKKISPWGLMLIINME